MPKDDYGFTADMVIDPASPIKRMNTGQLYECAINRVSEFIRRRIAEMVKTDPEAAFEYLVTWYGKVNPNYGDLVRQIKNTPASRKALVEEAVADFPKINIPPTMGGMPTPEEIAEHTPEDGPLTMSGGITPAVVLQWFREYDIPIGPVTFASVDRHGNKRYVRTRNPVLIGTKYMMLLCKIPKATSSGVAYVSHKGTPIKPGKEAKYSSPVSITPVRAGEDENRVALVDVDGVDVGRMSQLMANTPKGIETVIGVHLHHPTPTNIDEMPITDAELYEKNAIRATFDHQVRTLGIDILNTAGAHIPPESLTFEGDVLGGVSHSDLDGEVDDTPSVEPKKRRKTSIIPTSTEGIRHVLVRKTAEDIADEIEDEEAADAEQQALDAVVSSEADTDTEAGDADDDETAEDEE